MVGLCPGSFDPITNGHLDIIERAVTLVDELVIGIAINTAKAPLFPLAERIQMIESEVHEISQRAETKIRVDSFDNLLVEFAASIGARIIIRGLRAVADFEYEFQMVGMNRILDPSVETVFLMAGAKHQAISSRLVKEIAIMGGDVSRFVPPGIKQRLLERVAEVRKS